MSDERRPRFGFTRHGLAVHARVADHHPDGTGYERFNKAVAMWITSHVFTMTCFWLFNLLAMCSLPAVLAGAHILHPSMFPSWLIQASFIALIAWVAQTYLQLVLLPSIGVGQQLQNAASDARAAKQFEDIEVITDRLDTRTQGGITEILTQTGKLGDQVSGLAEAVQAVMAARAGHDSAVAADAKAARTAAESAFVATQALAAVATAKPGPGELAAAVAENTKAVRQVHQAVTAPAASPDPGPVAVKPKT